MSEKRAKWLTTLAVALIVLQIITLTRVNWLYNERNDLENRLVSLEMKLSNTMSNISSDIRQQLEQETSIIDSYAYEFGALNAESLTIAVTFSVSPKELAADTSATLEVSGRSVPMQRQGDSFVATLDAGLFDVVQQPKVILETGGLRQQETIEMGFDPRYEALPEMYAWLDRPGGSTTYRAGENNGGTYYLNGTVQIDSPDKGVQVGLSDVRLAAELDGKEIWRLDEKDFPNNNISDNAGGSVFTDLGQSIAFPLLPGQSLRVYAQATDECGVVHRVLLDQVDIDENGEPRWDEGDWLMGQEMLLDKNGKVLWQPEY